MRSTEIDRRLVLRLLGAASALTAGTGPGLAFAAQSMGDGPLFAGARRESDGRYSVAVTTPEGLELLVVPLPGRGHDIAFDPATGRCVAFARRPGTFAVLFDVAGRRPPLTMVAPEGRHYYGHGVFSPDGRLLYATENDYEAVRGVIGIYDVSGAVPRRIGELDSGGVGPHDLALMADGRTIAIANGGIETRPDYGRDKLNLKTMRPSIVFLDRETGEMVATQELDAELHQLSLRHMALDGAGRVWVGGQYEGPEDDRPPLVARFSRDGAPLVLPTPASLRDGLRNYVGSVTANAAGDIVATSCPRGGQILYWAAADGRFLGSQAVVDGCGVAPIDEAGFLISDGRGGLSYCALPEEPLEPLAASAGIAWDNHLVAVGG